MTTVDSFPLARTVVTALVEGGVREAVVCPGSRSAPLAYALAEAERAGHLRLHVRIDERSAGFLAHGLSLATSRPVAVLTTSGSAVGNLLPALMESWHAGTRVVALTADRPAELQGTGANQTTRQEGLYPNHVRFCETVDGDPAAGDTAERHLEVVAGQVHRALLAADGFVSRLSPDTDGGEAAEVTEAAPGPVQLNLRFRDPLTPTAEQTAQILGAGDGAAVPVPDAQEQARAAMRRPRRAMPPARGTTPPRRHDDLHPATGVLPDLSAYLATDQRSEDAAEPWRPVGADLSGIPPLDVATLPQHRTVVLACHGAGPVAAAFAVATGLPLFAEPSSNARFGANAVSAYPLLLGSGGGTGADSHPLAADIERVVLFGRPTLSRQVAALLAREDVKTALFVPEPQPWFEDGARRERTVRGLHELAEFAGGGSPGWLQDWQTASLSAQAALEQVLSRAPGDKERHAVPSPQAVGHYVAATVRGPLVLGSSSAVRDVDLTWRPPVAAQSTVYANRGLSGIDGNVSTAAGIALATGQRTVLLCGDLTLLHDAGGLFVGRGETGPDLDIVVVNDSGGAIFSGLEHGEVAARDGMGPIVERLFTTPHDVDLAALAAAYGAEHRRITSLVNLLGALGEPSDGRRIFEVRVDPAQRPEAAAQIAEAVRGSCTESLRHCETVALPVLDPTTGTAAGAQDGGHRG